MDTTENTTGAPSECQDEAASSSEAADSRISIPPAPDAPPQPARKPKTGETNTETGQSAPPDAAAAASASTVERKLTLETQEVVSDISVTHIEGKLVDKSSEVTKFLPYDHEASSGQWVLRLLMEFVLFLCLTGIFVVLLVSNVLESSRIHVWILEGWRLCLMIYLALAGWIVAKWVVQVVEVLADHLVIHPLRVFQIKKKKSTETENKENEALKDREIAKVKEYFDNVTQVAQGMRGSTRVFIWIASLLVAWILLFREEKEATRLPQHIKDDVDNVTRALFATLVGVFLWALKKLLVQLLAWSFIVNMSEKSIAASCKNQQQVVELWKLIMNHFSSLKSEDQRDSSQWEHEQQPDRSTSTSPKLSFRNWVLSGLMDMVIGEEEKSRNGHGRKVLNQEYDVVKKVRRDWTPRYLIQKITARELPVYIMARKTNARSISLERVARATADYIFGRIVKICDPSVEDAKSDEVRYIKQESLAKVKKVLAKKLEEVIPLIPLHLDGDNRRFWRSDFRKWMIKVYTERLILIRAITGRDNVIGELNHTLSCVAALVILFVWLIITRSLTVQVMISIATFIGALKFIFNDTARTAFESIMFLFATRPFDVGNRCVVGENENMIVHDMNILSTIFIRADGQMLYYPNSVLIKEKIINCRFDQEDRAERVEFKVDQSIFDRREKLREEIEKYMENKHKIWDTEKCKMKIKKIDYFEVPVPIPSGASDKKGEVPLAKEKDKVHYLLTLSLRRKANFYTGGDKKTQREELVEKMERTITNLPATAE